MVGCEDLQASKQARNLPSCSPVLLRYTLPKGSKATKFEMINGREGRVGVLERPIIRRDTGFSTQIAPWEMWKPFLNNYAKKCDASSSHLRLGFNMYMICMVSV